MSSVSCGGYHKRPILFHSIIISTILQLVLVVATVNSQSDLQQRRRHNETTGMHGIKNNSTATTESLVTSAITDPTGVPLSSSSNTSSSSSSAALASNERGAMVKCGNTQKMVDNCFRDLPPHLMEFLQTSKIAINEQEITSKCK